MAIPDPAAVPTDAAARAVPPAGTRSRRTAFVAVLVLLALLAAAVLGTRAWMRYDARQRAHTIGTDERLTALDERIDALRRDQRALVARLQQADATNRVLRDEVLGVGQRAALIEDTVARLADPDRTGAQALRLDEAEMLLALGEQRLAIAGDLDGALRAYALARRTLDGIDDPAYLSLRQALAQERAALEALGIDPRVRAIARLDAFAREATQPVRRDAAATEATAPWWERAFARLVDVRPSERAVAVDGGERAAALAGLQLELTLARVAAERRDVDGYRAALQRADGWLQRLGAPPARRDALRALARTDITLAVPTLGSTLEQLRRMRAAR